MRRLVSWNESREDGEVVEEGRVRTSEEALRRHFEGEARQRIAMEWGTHSPWISRLLKKLGTR